MSYASRSRGALLAAVALLPLSGCMVGPKYTAPAAITAPAFKEAPPASFAAQDGWKAGEPGDTRLKGDWWTIFSDSALNDLEVQVDTANQTVKAAEANFRAARAQVSTAKSYEAPTIGVGPAVSTIRESANEPYFNRSLASNGSGNFTLPIDLNYEVDLWGRIRRGVTSAREQAQASDADLETARLSLHAELAMDYFGLRSDDAQTKLLHATVAAYQHALQLTRDRFDGGVAPQSDVTEAQTQLDQANVQLTDIEVQRTAYEHAIAVLTGKPPAALTIPALPINERAPAIAGYSGSDACRPAGTPAGYRRR